MGEQVSNPLTLSKSLRPYKPYQVKNDTMYSKKIIIALMAIFILEACSKVPITGRKQVKLLPEYMLIDMSLDSYSQFLSESTVIKSTSEANMVQTIGNKMSKAVGTYLRADGSEKRIEGFKWQFNLVDDPQVNAWCMPGGKVVVYSGILPVTKTETGLATVMDHEIAHAIARHGNERMSQGLALQMGALGLDVALRNKPEQTRALFNTAYGVGATLGLMLPYSRLHETEADKMGLVFMALAGYDPSESVRFWERMAAQSSGAPPQFLSTHPSHETRIKNLKAFLPEAHKIYNLKKK